VVIPAYKEEKRLRVSLPRILEYLQGCDYAWEILVVDDGSPDRTSEAAKELLAGSPHTVLRNEPNAGKGASIRRGMLESRGAHALFTDADLSTPIEDVERMWSEIEKGADVVFGSRTLPESELIVRQPFVREMGGRVFNVLVRMLVLGGFSDTQCGFKMFTRRAANIVFPLQKMDGFVFDVEILAIAKEAGLKLRDVPVRWEDSPVSTLNPITDGLKTYADLLKVRKRIKELKREGAIERQRAAT
jgi:dolichyl-phosphate beta-glucosyltransferase